MRRATLLTKHLLLAAALVSVASCGKQPIAITPPAPPADLFAREDRPAATAEALTSDEAAEKLDRDRDDWGKTTAVRFDAACRWIRDTLQMPLTCREQAEWEAPPG